MTQTPSIPPTEQTPARGAWGLSVCDDGRVALTYAGQLVATANYRTQVEQARVHALYAALVRRGASR